MGGGDCVGVVGGGVGVGVCLLVVFWGCIGIVYCIVVYVIMYLCWGDWGVECLFFMCVFGDVWVVMFGCVFWGGVFCVCVCFWVFVVGFLF